MKLLDLLLEKNQYDNLIVLGKNYVDDIREKHQDMNLLLNIQ